MKNAVSYNKAFYGHMRYCIFFMILFLPTLSMAQTRGKVDVVKDPLIDTLIARRPYLNKTSNNPTGEETTIGYRVQIFSGSNRQAAYSAQAKFSDEYPEYRTYITYTEPNFKVQVGDFRSRLEAVKLQNELRTNFTSLFIITGKVNPPKSDSSND